MDRKHFLALLGATALCLAAGPLLVGGARAHAGQDGGVGSVYTMTNDPSGNDVAIFERDEKGALSMVGTMPTGGLGSGGGLDPLASQSSLVLTSGNRWLLAVNAGSNEISVFRVKKNGLELTDKVHSGGAFPTSLAVFHDLVYVLNTGGTPNITGFMLNHWGHLAPIPSSTRMLAGVLAAQIGFDPQGDVLVVTDRASNNLIVFPVAEDGAPTPGPVLTASHGAGPFAFAFSGPRQLLVAEVSSNAVSSYRLQDDGSLTLVTGSVPNGQAATCWIAIGKEGFAYTTNPGTSSLSAYRVHPGQADIRLLAGVAGSGAAPLDLTATEDGRFLYALDPGTGGIDAFAVEPDGHLINIGPVPAGLPTYAQGLAAR
jgi:6-phosphogluconolactonase